MPPSQWGADAVLASPAGIGQWIRARREPAGETR